MPRYQDSDGPVNTGCYILVSACTKGSLIVHDSEDIFFGSSITYFLKKF